MKNAPEYKFNKNHSRLAFNDVHGNVFVIPTETLTLRMDVDKSDPDEPQYYHLFYWGSKGKAEVDGVVWNEVQAILMDRNFDVGMKFDLTDTFKKKIIEERGYW